MSILRIYISNNSDKIVYKKDKLKIKLFRSIVYNKSQFAKNTVHRTRQYYASLSYRR